MALYHLLRKGNDREKEERLPDTSHANTLLAHGRGVALRRPHAPGLPFA